MTKQFLRILGLLAIVFVPAQTFAADGKIFMENNVDRAGANYREFEVVRSGGPAVCHQECSKDGTCKAWTYVRPGVEGAQGICKLKSVVPHGFDSPCCISGLNVGSSVGPVYNGIHASADVQTTPKQSKRLAGAAAYLQGLSGYKRIAYVAPASPKTTTPEPKLIEISAYEAPINLVPNW